jgi:NMT1-like family
LAGGRHFAPERDGADRSNAASARPAEEGGGITACAERGERCGKKAAKPEKGTGKTKGATADKGKGAKNDKSDQADKSDKTTKVAAKNADKTTGKNADKTADNSDDADSKDDKTGGDANDANKLDSVSKLAGHRVGVVTGNAATREVLDVVLSHYGVPLNQVQVSLIDPSHIAEAVKAQQVDVLFVAGAETGQAINDVVAAATVNGQAPSFIPIDQAEGMAKRSPAFQSVDIEAGTFGGNPPAPPDELKSLSFPEYLVAKKSFHHDAVGTLAKLIFTSRLALAAAMPSEIKIRAPATEKDANIVVHPGALAYLNDDQKSFFDKYGDDIFYGLLTFPIFGSAIAGVASYFRSSGRTRRLRLLQRLLDLTQKANHAPSLEALDRLQVDVDHLVVAIIHQTEQEEYDEAVQASFGLALDQVRFAIASRRTVLLEHGGSEAKPGAKAAAA